ncbi:MAG TPA: hypothetical protein VFU59_03285, partial [Candidatus Eisenbacteria bacterium]|nr:hypothetical protein [Candidatus Eisenbacteria bacterium]
AALVVAATVALVAFASGRAGAETLRGYAQLQYQSQDQRGGRGDDIEWWLRSVHLDYGTKFRDDLDLTVQGEWNELSYVDRPDRQLNPRGSLRLAHREFGISTAYRPLRVTDAQGVTTRQRETTVSGYLRRRALPQLSGTFVRRRQLAVGLSPAATSLTGTVNATYDFGALDLHGGWNNQVRFTDLDQSNRTSQVNWTGGATWNLARRRSSANFGFEFQEGRRHAERGPTSESSGRSATITGAHRFSKRVDAGLNYGYRHSSATNVTTRKLDDHDGALLLSYRPRASVTFSSGGGLRTARLADEQEIERYLVASAAVQGPIRPGWTGGANLARSYNWLPGQSSRPVDSGVLSSRMRLARGLDANAQTQVTAARASSTVADTSGARNRVTSQTSLGFLATPLHGFTFGYTRSDYRTGRGVFDPQARSHSDTWDGRWNPVPSLQFSGNLSRARGLSANEPSLRTRQATAAWSPSGAFQLSGTYTRNDRSQFAAFSQSVAGREVYGARLLASIAREWRVQVSVNDVDPGKPTHVRQWDATVTRNVRR